MLNKYYIILDIQKALMPTELQPFKTILFGFAFSPSLRANVLETTRIAHYFNARLILLHVGEKTDGKSAKINEILTEIEHKDLPLDIQWEHGKTIQCNP